VRVPPATLYNLATDGYDRCMAVHEHVHDLVSTLRPVVLGVTDGALDDPTPCSGWTVRDLTNHLLGTTEAMRRVGAGEDLDPDDPWGTAGDHMSEEWRDLLVARLEELARAWDSAEAYEGAAMGGQMPKQMVGQMAFVEVLLHGWDLARATGQTVAADDATLAAAEQVMAQIGEMGRQQGAFGALVELPEDAAPLDRVLAQGGRDPGWTPDRTAGDPT
jgi:uncharacterized protein (TIGR03086 family)